MTHQTFPRFPTQALLSRCVAAASLLVALASSAIAQAPPDSIVTLRLSVGRSQTVRSANAITNVSIASPEVADAVVISARDCVINAKANGTTDIVLWTSDGAETHYRVRVRSAADRQMILLSVRLAEVRRDVLRELGFSGLFRDKDGKVRIGWGNLRSGTATNETSGEVIPVETRFLTLLSNFGTKEFLGFLEAEEKLGNARLLAEPNLLTGDGDSATFLAGGEIPIPVAQPSSVGGQAYVTVQYREFGVRLKFAPEIISDSLVRLWVRPEVSSLDYGNAVTIAGFSIPALRTRRVESSVDVRGDQSLIISGLFNEEREQVKTGIPLLMHVPIIGSLFSSTRWQQAESELLVVVTPMLVDPANVDPSLQLPLMKDARIPAADALKKRLPPPPPKP
jgi:pilus assembly protein CpaC